MIIYSSCFAPIAESLCPMIYCNSDTHCTVKLTMNVFVGFVAGADSPSGSRLTPTSVPSWAVASDDHHLFAVAQSELTLRPEVV